MTRFVNQDFPTEHPGVVRAEALMAHGQSLAAALASAAANAKQAVTTTRGLTTLLLAAVVSALILVADQLVDTWADDHLFAAWVALWTLIFATLAVFAPVIKRLLDQASTEWTTWRHKVEADRSEAAFLESAQNDPRVLEELRAAILRHEAAQFETVGVIEPNVALDRVMNMLPPNKRYLRYI